MSFRFIKTALLTNIKLNMSFHFSFILTIVISVIKHSLFLIIWRFFFDKYKTVHGWDFHHLSFMYASVCISTGIIEAFFYGLKDLPRTIDNGGLDVFLLQPKNILLNIALSKGDVAAFGDITMGIILLIISGFLAPKTLLAAMIILLLSIIFMFALNIYISSIAFFMKDSRDFIRELSLNTIIIASNPNSAYKGLLKVLTYTVLPVGFMSYFPIEYLRTGDLAYLGLTLAGTLTFLWISFWIFSLGLRRYNSGSLIGVRI